MSESDTSGKRPLSYIEDEEIEIKPSTELIADEYERINNESVLVELIYRKSDEKVDELTAFLMGLGFLVNKTTIDKVKITDEWVNDFVDNVKEKTKSKAYEGLIMVFAKVPLRNDILKEIWGNFTSKECPELKNKPKIFIFQVLKKSLETDVIFTTLSAQLATAYDTPSEADILIIYDKILTGYSSDFLQNFHAHIINYGHREDIINLVSLSLGSINRPLVISTMTRKFFFTLSEYRGHHHNINENNAEIKEKLEKIIKYVKNLPDHKPKEKGKNSISSRIKKSFSFSNKHQHGKESDNGENNTQESENCHKLIEVKEEKANADTSSQQLVVDSSTKKPEPLELPVEPIISPSSTSPTRRTSTTSVPHTPGRKITPAARFPPNPFSSKEDISKKPPWK